MSGKNWRFILTGILIVLAAISLWDTFKLWTMDEATRTDLETNDPATVTAMQQKAIRLGLDLQGGIHVVLAVDTAGFPDESSRDDAVDRVMQIIRNRVDGLGVAEPQIRRMGANRIQVDMPGYTDAQRAEELIGQTALLVFKLLETNDNAALLIKRLDSAIAEIEKAKLSEEELAELEADAEDAASDAPDPSIAAELLGDTVTDTAGLFDYDENELAAEIESPLSSRLRPALVSSRTNTYWPAFSVDKKERERIEHWLNDPRVSKVFPIDVQWAWSTRSEVRESKEVYTIYFLKRKEQFLGKFLESINMSRSQTGQKVVNFALSGQPSARFSQLTGANIDKPLAIVLDDRVESAPIISSKIRGNGQITMGGSATMEDARNMEIVLKAGALPAKVEIIEKNVVGASLGADSIKKGFYSSLIGLALVLTFIGVYYRLSGIIADIGLLFNIFFLLSILAFLDATLTMPGIAGIILTIGMSVDSNILIFERIREELRTGKTVRASIEAGYDRAFVAIFDSHVTTMITAGALFLLGSGPIKGFAVTLFWGILISLYTAFVVTKQVFDLRASSQRLSI